jgi:phytoene dehydrogenase-like protein
MKSLYKNVNCTKGSPRLQKRIKEEKEKLLPLKSGESVFSLFLALNEDPETFRKISKGHFIYTPDPHGLGDLHRKRLQQIKDDFDKFTKEEVYQWLKDFCHYNTYEISIPVLKDKTLAPDNKTGIIISLLFDGQLLHLVETAGFYEEFKDKTTLYILNVLNETIYPGLKKRILFEKSATPLTLEKMFNTSDGAITGWSLEGKIPVPRSLTRILGSSKTKIPHVYTAGQWSYSPSGVPVAILTGRIAAGKIHQMEKKSRKYFNKQKYD